jgi:hypothetical protein
MRLVLLSLLCLSAYAASPASDSAKLLSSTPIRFEAGPTGQWRAHGQGYAFQFTADGTQLRVGDRTIGLTFPGASRAARFDPSGEFQAPTNYFIGKSYRSVPAYARLHRIGIYPGIDLVYYGNGGQMEYDFEIAPGADPARIRMKFEGADAVSLNERGDVVLALGAGEVLQRAPVVYQKRPSGEIVKIDSRYRIAKDRTVRVDVGDYDRSGRLVVDPTITYTAYLTGSQTDWAVVVGHDSQGNIYMAGNTWSVDFPVTADSLQTTEGGNQDVWVMEITPSTSTITYCTYLGGAVNDTVTAGVVDTNGIVYLTGVTLSGDFPTTNSGFQSVSPAAGNNHAFVSVLNPTLGGVTALTYSTYLGGTTTEEGDGIAVANGMVYVTGFTTSTDFPVTATPYQSTLVQPTCPANVTCTYYDAFVAQLDPTQSGAASEIYATYLGGSSQDLGRAITADSAGNIYVTGVTYSFDFPVAGNSVQPTYAGDGDVFLSVLNPSAGTLTYSTFLGGQSVDEAKKILLDPSGRAVLTGYTLSPDFRITQGAYQTGIGANGNAFLSIVDLSQGLVYSTFFGGSGGEVAYDMKRDSAGRYLLAGYTMSPNFPVTANALNPSSVGGSVDGFVALIDPSQPPFSPNALVYSSYVTSPGYQVVYGADIDSSGTIYVTGLTTSSVFPSGFAVNTYALKQSGFVLLFTLP